MMAEVNRILKPGGHAGDHNPELFSAGGVAILQGYHPGFFSPLPGLVRPSGHRLRERAMLVNMLRASSLRCFAIEVSNGRLLENGRSRENPTLSTNGFAICWTLQTGSRPAGRRPYAAGVNTGPVPRRYPAWLYS